MTDLLDELRDADPVDRDMLEIPATLAARVAAGRRRRTTPRSPLVAVSLIAVAIVAALAVTRGDDGSRLSLADKAYAATTGAGVRHWKISIRTYIDGTRRGVVQRQEGWARGGILHILLFEQGRLTGDIRETPARSRSWGAGMNDYIDTPRPKQHAPSGPLALGDPFAEFRRAHDDGELVRVNATTYRMRPDKRAFPSDSSLTYELDPATALPVRAVLAWTRGRDRLHPERSGARYRSVFTYDLYERLADTAANRAKLELLPHPGAGPSKTDARTVFSILRDGAPLTVKQRELVASFAKAGFLRKTRFDPATARRGPHDVVLIAGKGYVGMMRGGGGTLAAVDLAVKRGMAIGGSAVNGHSGMYVVAPDGVRAIRARLPRHAWRTFPVRQNVAVLPKGGYHFRFVR